MVAVVIAEVSDVTKNILNCKRDEFEFCNYIAAGDSVRVAYIRAYGRMDIEGLKKVIRKPEVRKYAKYLGISLLLTPRKNKPR